jgi:Pyridoxamine 5'-phosphate oxidase
VTEIDAVTQPLDEAECLRLIAPGGVGRIGYSGRFGPTILPVNFALHEQTIVFRTGRHSPMGEDLRTGIADAEYKVAFEIDEISPATREGWSILIQGSAHHVDSAAELAEVSGPACRPGRAARKTCSSASSRTASPAAAFGGRREPLLTKRTS